MKMHGEWLFSIVLGYMIFAAFLLLQVYQGTDPLGALAVGLVAGGICAVVIVLSLPKWERMRSKQLEESNRGFPWRRFASGNACLVGVMGLLIADGWNGTSLEWGAVVLFCLGNTMVVVQWLMLRREARQALGKPEDPPRQPTGSASERRL